MGSSKSHDSTTNHVCYCRTSGSKRSVSRAGYEYLLKSIAVDDGPKGTDKSDLVRYYSGTGTSPGVFLGAGLVGLDDGREIAVGQSVTAENLQRMLQGCAGED